MGPVNLKEVLDWWEATKGGTQGDRRAHPRFEVQFNLKWERRWHRTSWTGQGRTINMSAYAVAFATSKPLPTMPFNRGANNIYELTIDWPVKLKNPDNSECGLLLAITGPILREWRAGDAYCYAVHIRTSYDFKTRKI